jgi:hypothetical protein
MRAAVVAVVTAALIPLSQAATAESASARPAQHPRSFTGYAFDTCDAPSQRAMNRWRTHSKYWAAGIYIAGINRACTSQPHLTPRWVERQTEGGWRLLPLVVGRQASCSPPGYYRGKRISARPAGRYAKARAQGRGSAQGAVRAAARLGIGKGSVLWFDLENFDITRDRCRGSATAFVSSWTRQVHHRGYLSGLYSSASSGIRMVDAVRARRGDPWRTPDYLWIAEWNYRDTLGSSYISRQRWWPDRRVHQYRGGHTERHGGAAINIDSNYLSVGGGTRAGTPHRHCGVRIDFASYRTLKRGDRGAKVRAAQCLLRKQGTYDGRLHGRLSAGTAKAVASFQRRNGHLPSSGTLGRSTWTALLASGRWPLLKAGSGGIAVRRLQRALNASSDARLQVDGVFGRRDMAEVRGFQKKARLPRTGVVTARTWRTLAHGRVVGRLPHARMHARTRARAMVRGLFLETPFSSGVARPHQEVPRSTGVSR